MALESATYISQLVPTNPVTTDPIAQASAHLNLIKTVLQNQFPNTGTVAITATPASLNAAGSAFAVGTIAAISGNGTVAAAELDLLGMINSGGTLVSGRVQLMNSSTLNGAGALAIKMTDSVDASSTLVATLSETGTLTASAAVSAPSIQENGSPLLPTGMIVMWSGSVASIPAGWIICDGTNSTPDLRGSFVIGAGGVYSPTATGGSSTLSVTTASAGSHNHTGADGSAGAHTHGGSTADYALQIADLAAHSHAVTVTDPGHTHGSVAGNFIIEGGPSSVQAGAELSINATSQVAAAVTGISVAEASVGSGNPHAHGINSDGSHTHAISTDGAHTHTISAAAALPPYYALCFIYKI